MDYKRDLKKIITLYPELYFDSDNDYKDLINIHNILEAAYGTVDKNIVKYALEHKNKFSLKNRNDYFYLVLRSVMSNKSIKKVAYPVMEVADSGLPEEYDLEKWAELVYKIYDAVSSQEMSLENAIDYYSNTLDYKSGEVDRFKKWMKYYQDGEHLKYNREELMDLAKRADFQFPLNGIGFYPGELFDNSDKAEDERKQLKLMENNKKEDSYEEWKKKLHGAIRRIDKLLRHHEGFLAPDVSRMLAELLHNFDLEVRGLKQHITASDRAFNIANKLHKYGFSDGANILYKFAQEAPAPTEPFDFDLEDNEDVPEAVPEGEEITPPGLETPETGELAQEPATPKDPLESSLEGGSTSEPGEYAELAGNIGISDAAHKLEQIAGRLADRRTVRLMAELDIMLDKIGIATMFPELAEAQSKLIDANTYALTRVTKMLGMLSSGRNLMEISEARKKELTDRTRKEVEKTFEPPEETKEESPEAITQEFGTPTPTPETQAPVEQPTPEIPEAAPITVPTTEG